MHNAVAAFAWLAVSALFPTPLHLVRKVQDPLSRTISTVDEFCAGNRIISISGRRVSISDYAAQLLTEIDHTNATYSITRFEDIAKARPAITLSSKATVRVEVDRSVALSRDAVEAIIGGAYPNRRDARHEQILAAAAPPASGRVAAQSVDSAYGLPTDTSIVFEEEGLTYRNAIVRFDHDPPPAEMLLIDPGAKRVESRLTREIQQLDNLPRQR